MLAAVEGGGTKFLCAVGEGPDAIAERARFETTTPDETLGRIADFLRRFDVDAVGVATFGPLDLAAGTTLDTPKPGWSHVNVRGRIAEACGGAPVAFETDVNAAALAEQRMGAGQGADPLLYVTVGTGVGGGLVVHEQPVHGLMHPEVGHLPVPVLDGDDFAGACPFHGRCLEGVASGTALRARLGRPPDEVPAGDPAWALTARHIGAALASVVLVASPRRIVVGGTVTRARNLLPGIRRALADSLAGYVRRPELDDLDRYVVAPHFEDAGLIGAFLLARTLT